jgi:hypothetical protein
MSGNREIDHAAQRRAAATSLRVIFYTTPATAFAGSGLNLRILVSNQCTAPMNDCAMVRVRFSMIGCSSTALCRSNWDRGGEMLSKEYLDTARTVLWAARRMTDRRVASELKTLAEYYERRAEKVVYAGAGKTLARPAARECERKVE